MTKRNFDTGSNGGGSTTMLFFASHKPPPAIYKRSKMKLERRAPSSGTKRAEARVPRYHS